MPVPDHESRPGEDHVLATADLSVIVPEGQRRRIVAMVVQAVMSAPIAAKIDRGKLESLLHSTFRRLCNGLRFDAEPMVRALLRVSGVTEEALYIPILNLQTVLETVDLFLPEPSWTLSKEVRARLILEGEAAMVRSRARHEASQERHKRSKERIRLGDLLVAEGHVSAIDLESALEFQRRYGDRIGTNLIRLGILSEELLAKFLSLQLGIPCCLSDKELDAVRPEVIALISPEFAEANQVMPLAVDKQRFRLAMAEPTDSGVIEEVALRSGYRVVPVVAPEFLIAHGLERHYGIRRTMALIRPRSPEASSKPVTTWRELPDEPYAPEEPEAEDMATMLLDMNAAAPRPDLPEVPVLVGLPVPGAVTPRLAPSRRVALPDAVPFAETVSAAKEEPEIYAALLAHLAATFDEAAVFVLQGSAAQGWKRTTSVPTAKVFLKTSVQISRGVGMFTQVATTRRLFYAPLVPSDENDEILLALELPPASAVGCLPMIDLRGVSGFAVFAARSRSERPDLEEIERVESIVGAALRMVGLKKQISALARKPRS